MVTRLGKPTEKIDIVVPTHGNLGLTMGAIDAIYRNTQTPFHLIIVDDSEASIEANKVEPTDVSSEYLNKLSKYHKNITYIKRDTPFISGNQFFNEAIAHMETEYLATIMNSISVEPDWERIALKVMKDDPKVGVIGFKCLYPNGSIESAGIEIFDGYLPIDIGRGAASHAFTDVADRIAVQWAFAMVRKEAVKGNLDETLFHGFKGWDDIDNCFVLKSKGWKIKYCGYGVGYHVPRATRGDDSSDGWVKNQANAKIFYKRWGLWNKYLESKSMDIGDRIPEDSKANFKAVVHEMQILDELKESRNNAFQFLATNLLKELGVDPDKYQLVIDPSRGIYDLKMKVEPENSNGDEATKKEIEAALKAREEAKTK